RQPDQGADQPGLAEGRIRAGLEGGRATLCRGDQRGRGDRQSINGCLAARACPMDRLRQSFGGQPRPVLAGGLPAVAAERRRLVEPRGVEPLTSSCEFWCPEVLDVSATSDNRKSPCLLGHSERSCFLVVARNSRSVVPQWFLWIYL